MQPDNLQNRGFSLIPKQRVADVEMEGHPCALLEAASPRPAGGAGWSFAAESRGNPRAKPLLLVNPSKRFFAARRLTPAEGWVSARLQGGSLIRISRLLFTEERQ